eukprot:INCI13374.2.p1 GENE.INCI13374.2~~INCI13374.2.p1  ORF type:complete len:467 (-),score=47.39 INCI13374.2:563-1963(-)
MANDFEAHLFKVLQGHRKRPTRVVHLVAVHWSVAALTCLISITLGISSVALCGFHLLSNLRAAGPKRLGLAVLTSTLVYGASQLLHMTVPASCQDLDLAVLVPGNAFSRSAGEMVFYLLVFVGMGLIESGSHYLFEDEPDLGHLTRGRTGLDKFLGVVFDVILPAPMYFLHLVLMDKGAFLSSLRWTQPYIAQVCIGGPGNYEPLASLEARLDASRVESEPAGAMVGSQTSRPGGPVSDVPFVWRQIPPSPRGTKAVLGSGSASASESLHGGNVQVTFETQRLSAWHMISRAKAFYKLMCMRRSLRFFSSERIPPGVLERVVATAGTAPSGAHKQPWTFVIVRSPSLKVAIRNIVEEEEKINYAKRMKKSWVRDLDGLTGKDADTRLLAADGAPSKPYLTEAPAVVVLMRQIYGIDDQGQRFEHYYVSESCGIATGVFIAGLQNVGLATLTRLTTCSATILLSVSK